MKKIITLLLITVTFCSCSDDDNSGRDSLTGIWQMTHYLSYSDVPAPVLAPGDVTWTIESGKLVVVNNSTDTRVYPKSGTYTASIDSKTILIKQEGFDSYYRYSISANELTLLEGEEGLQDGIAIKFTKLLEE